MVILPEQSHVCIVIHWVNVDVALYGRSGGGQPQEEGIAGPQADRYITALQSHASKGGWGGRMEKHLLSNYSSTPH